MKRAAAVLAVAACAPKAAPVVGAEPDAVPAEPSGPSSARSPVVGPVDWIDASGLCLAVPSGWTGTAGPPPEVLVLDAEGGGAHVAVHLLAAGQTPPVDREGFVLAFEDLGSYRTVPLLTPASLRSWQSIDPTGPVLMAWWGEVASDTVAVEATFPHGGATEGLDRVQPLLAGLCRR